jgi:hypothetical protein
LKVVNVPFVVQQILVVVPLNLYSFQASSSQVFWVVDVDSVFFLSFNLVLEHL